MKQVKVIEGGSLVNLDGYQREVERTCATTTPNETIQLALIGMLGELGEIAEPCKKHVYGGHDLDILHMEEEIGDLLWYLATLCNALNISMEQAIIGNVAKLRMRYPDGYDATRSREREVSA